MGEVGSGRTAPQPASARYPNRRRWPQPAPLRGQGLMRTAHAGRGACPAWAHRL
jgi:hypothetical protein